MDGWETISKRWSCIFPKHFSFSRSSDEVHPKETEAIITTVRQVRGGGTLCVFLFLLITAANRLISSSLFKAQLNFLLFTVKAAVTLGGRQETKGQTKEQEAACCLTGSDHSHWNGSGCWSSITLNVNVLHRLFQSKTCVGRLMLIFLLCCNHFISF